MEMAADSLPLAEKYPERQPTCLPARLSASSTPGGVPSIRSRKPSTRPSGRARNSAAVHRVAIQEFVSVREPVFAAWVMTLCPDRTLVLPHREAILKVLAHYRYDRLYYSQFFPAEAAWFRLKALQPE